MFVFNTVEQEWFSEKKKKKAYTSEFDTQYIIKGVLNLKSS